MSFLFCIGSFIHVLKSESGGSVSNSCFLLDSKKLFSFPKYSAAVKTLCPVSVAASIMFKNCCWDVLRKFF